MSCCHVVPFTDVYQRGCAEFLLNEDWNNDRHDIGYYLVLHGFVKHQGCRNPDRLKFTLHCCSLNTTPLATLLNQMQQSPEYSCHVSNVKSPVGCESIYNFTVFVIIRRWLLAPAHPCDLFHKPLSLPSWLCIFHQTTDMILLCVTSCSNELNFLSGAGG